MSTVLNTPILWINQYLAEKVSADVFGSDNNIPFFPTGPSTIDTLTETFANTGESVIAVYDRMFRRRKGSFPHIKCEQVLYYFYANNGNNPENMIKTQESVLRLMDREDESAEELNKWAIQKGSIPINGENLTPQFHFHSFRIYQLEEARDIIDFGTARTFAGNKIIIDYDYHQRSTVYDQNGNLTTDAPLQTKP